jgi:hypothetical protein
MLEVGCRSRKLFLQEVKAKASSMMEKHIFFIAKELMD